MAGSKSYLGRTCPTPQCIPLPAKYSCHYCHFRVSAQHCCANPAGQEASERGYDVRIGNCHLQQPLEVRAAGHPRNTCCAPGLWLPFNSSSCSGFPAALGPGGDPARPFRAGQGCAHSPTLPLKLSTSACRAVLMLLLVLCATHCQQTSITSLSPQDTAVGGAIP